MGPNLSEVLRPSKHSYFEMRLLDVMTHTHGYGVIVGYRSKLKSMVLQGINMGRIGTSMVDLPSSYKMLTGEGLLEHRSSASMQQRKILRSATRLCMVWPTPECVPLAQDSTAKVDQ